VPGEPSGLASCHSRMPLCPLDAISPAVDVSADQVDLIDTNQFVFAEVSGA